MFGIPSIGDTCPDRWVHTIVIAATPAEELGMEHRA